MVPVRFTKDRLPCINVTIEGVSYPLVIDLGADQGIEMESSVVQNISKRKIGIRKWINLWGKEFIYPNYNLPKAKIGSMVFRDIHLTEISKEDRQKYNIVTPARQKERVDDDVGILGIEFLKRINLLFDMRLAKIIITNDIARLKKDGYDLEKFTKVSFQRSFGDIQLDVVTDLGMYKLVLDTGCTLTFFHEFLYPENVEKTLSRHKLPYLTTQQFSLGGKDFGPLKLHFLPITEKLKHLEGLLGMDFVQNYVIYIDFSKDLIYIRRN